MGTKRKRGPSSIAFALALALVGGLLVLSSFAATTGSPDLNGDGQVDIRDLSLLLINFGKSGSSLKGDLNGDGRVAIQDLSLLLVGFGKPVNPPPPPPPGSGDLTYEQVLAMVDSFAAAHSGKDTDINRGNGYTLPGAAELRAVCGTGWTSVYPRLAWEYGGNDHAWISPDASPLLICVHAPTKPPYSAEWTYDSNANHVTAMVFVKFPTQSPCQDNLATCMTADTSNYEILVDEAGGGNDNGASVGLNLDASSTELVIRLANGSMVHLWNNT